MIFSIYYWIQYEFKCFRECTRVDCAISLVGKWLAERDANNSWVDSEKRKRIDSVHCDEQNAQYRKWKKKVSYKTAFAQKCNKWSILKTVEIWHGIYWWLLLLPLVLVLLISIPTAGIHFFTLRSNCVPYFSLRKFDFVWFGLVWFGSHRLFFPYWKYSQFQRFIDLFFLKKHTHTQMLLRLWLRLHVFASVPCWFAFNTYRDRDT